MFTIPYLQIAFCCVFRSPVFFPSWKRIFPLFFNYITKERVFTRNWWFNWTSSNWRSYLLILTNFKLVSVEWRIMNVCNARAYRTFSQLYILQWTWISLVVFFNYNTQIPRCFQFLVQLKWEFEIEIAFLLRKKFLNLNKTVKNCCNEMN